jgi:DNA repair protein RadC
LFTGTLNQTMVYPREIVALALTHHAAAVILVHNHPSGEPEPSQADKLITQKITDALSLLDIRVVDHLIVGGDDAYSLQNTACFELPGLIHINHGNPRSPYPFIFKL